MSTILKMTGAPDRRVLVGPKPGVDTSIISVGSTRVVIASTDPISLIPEIGPRASAVLSVHTVASDVATSGVSPMHALFDLNLPPNMTDNTIRQYWTGVHQTCKGLGISIVGGHTGRFPGCNMTIVGGASMFAIASKGSYVTSAMAQDHDDLVVTKSAGVEATGVLANSFPQTVRRKLGETTLRTAKRLLKSTSTVEDALTASSVGLRSEGVTAMHDVTEGGVLSAVLDVAEASGLQATVNQEAIPIYDEVQRVCRLFQIDPLRSLGQGCLIIACRPDRTDEVVRTLRKSRIPGTVIGKLSRRNGPSKIQTRYGTGRLSRLARDPYWNAYWDSIHRRLR